MWRYLKQTSCPNLSARIPLAAIAEANREVQVLQEAQKSGQKRGPYYRFTQEERLEIGKYAAENGTAAAVRKFNRRTTVTKPLNESTVRGLKRKYEDVLKEKKRTVSVEDIENNPEALQIHALPAKKWGRPVALGEDLDQQLQVYVCALRSAGAVVNTAIVRAAARRIVSSTNCSQLYEFGGHLTLSKEWGKSVLRRMGFVKRKANTVEPSILS